MIFAQRAQTWAEFILVSATFISIVGIVCILAFNTASAQSLKLTQTQACLKLQALHNFLIYPGDPPNWNATTDANVFGLGAGNGSVSYAHWSNASILGYAKVSQKSSPESPWRIDYAIYAFAPLNENCIVNQNAVTICRKTDGLQITANSSFANKINLVLYFPLTSINVISSTEPNDQIVQANLNGTILTLLLNINSTDQDEINVSFSSKPDLIFLQKAVSEKHNFVFLLRNISIQNSFGAQTLLPKNLCTIKLIKPFTIEEQNETVLAQFTLSAW
ncbi:MAG: hypothetical protein ACP5KK_01625 [Candidatus Nanoarchaeia archaeon]